MKQCNKCNGVFDDKHFQRNRRLKDGLTDTCKVCLNEQRRTNYQLKKDGTFVSKARMPRLTDEQRSQRKDEHREYNKQYRLRNLETLKIQKKNYMNKTKLDGIIAYGGKCSCCGESTYEFLTIEHLNGRDKSDKKKLTGKQMWVRAKAEGYPDTYTVLCFNCNCAKGAFGTCPHQRAA